MANLVDIKEDYMNKSFEILKEIGAIKFCDCGNYYYDTGKYDENKQIYAVATNNLKDKYGDVQDFDLFCDCIYTIINDCTYDSKCPHCNKE